jgi:aldehyde dehydrogenase
MPGRSGWLNQARTNRRGSVNAFDLKKLGLDVEYPYREKYENYIGGKWVPPINQEYFENVSPINGQPFCRIPRSTVADVDAALDAAHAARRKWGKTSAAERSSLLLAAAHRMEKHIKLLAIAETIDNGKPLRESLAADLPLAIDHFRYFAGCL